MNKTGGALFSSLFVCCVEGTSSGKTLRRYWKPSTIHHVLFFLIFSNSTVFLLYHTSTYITCFRGIYRLPPRLKFETILQSRQSQRNCRLQNARLFSSPQRKCAVLKRCCCQVITENKLDFGEYAKFREHFLCLI